MTKNVFRQFEKNPLVKHFSIIADSEGRSFLYGNSLIERRDRMAKAFKNLVQKVTILGIAKFWIRRL